MISVIAHWVFVSIILFHTSGDKEILNSIEWSFSWTENQLKHYSSGGSCQCEIVGERRGSSLRRGNRAINQADSTAIAVKLFNCSAFGFPSSLFRKFLHNSTFTQLWLKAIDEEGWRTSSDLRAVSKMVKSLKLLIQSDPYWSHQEQSASKPDEE